MARINAAQNGQCKFLKLVWTQTALADRKSIRVYIAADNTNAALDFDKMLSEKAARLLEHPNLGRLGRVANTHELVVHPNYILIYDIIDDLIRVLRILHTARQWPLA